MSQAQVQNNGVRLINNPAALLANGQPSRIDRWLGNESQPGPQQRKFIQLTPEMMAKMSPEQIVQVTMNNLAFLGEEDAKIFTQKMLKLPHKMKTPEEFRPTVLPSAPFLGACKFGEVMLQEKNGRALIQQFYRTNFDGELNTSGTGEFYKPNSKEMDKMYFGVNVVVDLASKKTLGFEKSRGDNGVGFKTKDPAAALFEVAAASTGKSVADLRQMVAGQPGLRP